MRRTRYPFSIAFALVLSAVLAFPAYAGPPLLCHVFDTGGAKSLPWVSQSWNLDGQEKYDLRNLVPDTLAILAPGAPILVRMETLRRASLYSRRDTHLAKELLVKLVARATAAESSGRPDALALFDAGYLAETYKQLHGDKEENPARGFDGYGWVKKALQLRGEDPQMEFAAALITSFRPSRGDSRQHFQKASAGAKSDALLARNLASFGHGN